MVLRQFFCQPWKNIKLYLFRCPVVLNWEELYIRFFLTLEDLLWERHLFKRGLKFENCLHIESSVCWNSFLMEKHRKVCHLYRTLCCLECHERKLCLFYVSWFIFQKHVGYANTTNTNFWENYIMKKLLIKCSWWVYWVMKSTFWCTDIFRNQVYEISLFK